MPRGPGPVRMRIMITAGPTREYLDDVRYLSNASSGRMGYALAEACRQAGHEVVLVSGPVDLAPPAGCDFVAVQITEEMRTACLQNFPRCDGVIAAAAVCDYTPRHRTAGKIGKTGAPLVVELVETPDILEELGRLKGGRWSVGFALESENAHARAARKLRDKHCDAIVLNGPAAIGARDNQVELIDRSGLVVARWQADKVEIARRLVAWIDENLRQS